MLKSKVKISMVHSIAFIPSLLFTKLPLYRRLKDKFYKTITIFALGPLTKYLFASIAW